MRFSLLLALGGSQVAIAAFRNSTTGGGGRGPQPTHSGIPGGAALPGRVGDFVLYGCTGSSAGFPTLTKVATTRHMTLDFCAASCEGREYFGAYDTDCWCGDQIDAATSRRVAQELCDDPCPGNSNQACGGHIGPGVMRRSSVPLTVLLSLYVRAKHTGTTKPPVTVTRTITRTTTGTITSCPHFVEDCPIGSKTTGVVTVTTEICPTKEWHRKKITCYGNHCAPHHHCEECERQRIVCDGDRCRVEVCHDNKDWNRLVFCKGDDCHFPECQGDDCKRKIVCFDGKCAHERCYGDECEKKLVCHGDDCKFEKCDGDECFKKIICDGDECKPAPPCDGDCPPPLPPLKPGKDGNDGKDGKDGKGSKDGKKHCDDGDEECQRKKDGNVGPPPQQGGKPPGPPSPPSPPPVVQAGSDRITTAFNLLAAAAGLVFLM